MMKDYWINKVITIHPEGDINVCRKSFGNPSNSYYIEIEILIIEIFHDKTKMSTSW